jgi:hypothetical protein
MKKSPKVSSMARMSLEAGRTGAASRRVRQKVQSLKKQRKIKQRLKIKRDRKLIEYIRPLIGQK